MKILFVTGLYPQENIEYFKEISKGNIQNAPNVFQWAVLDGFYQNSIDLEVISFPFLPSFSYNGCSRLYPHAYNLSYMEKKYGIVSSYCTFPLLKSLSIKYRLRKHVRNWIKKNYDKNEQYVVLLYQPLSYYLTALSQIKKEYKNLTIAAIVTDLNDDVSNFSSNNKILKRIQLSYEKQIIKTIYKLIDKFILLSPYMVEKIPEAINKNIVMEGIYSSDNNIKEESQETTEKILLYAGTLQKFSGVMDLVDAFTKIDNPDFRLVICGKGFCDSYINEKSKVDSRIVFKGLIDREEVIKLQQQAVAVINPRKPTELITRYSFPSKTMEYLASGTPMIGYKLPGIPEEYYKYYYTINDCSEETLRQTILNVMSLSNQDLKKKALSARLFIQNNKSSKVQVKRLLDFFKTPHS